MAAWTGAASVHGASSPIPTDSSESAPIVRKGTASRRAPYGLSMQAATVDMAAVSALSLPYRSSLQSRMRQQGTMAATVHSAPWSCAMANPAAGKAASSESCPSSAHFLPAA